ncbi:MAG: Ribulose-phosphate 3-epimerase [Candidatus Woesebacteria bacterium GW2011_GWB1_43_14]|uniref:Ribulose-phosphate 3-epimerase n=1 Tax=Candidatus Woesebacteria bacterium GW2011_GWB1_43_14 TaxID=1618578 RepID=A0A0G1DMV8_9BACT|nr:MAG: hypothetical protein UV51_C0002G0011 [Candidatus Woesebacteria bacterium GW2011_GWC1_42_9]KKS98912.1 MAG: Ribulose-phosphate 3-epimerase [Candidatus Woesebacteria bacterium GW2011_GWB1_43_14]
MVEIIPAILTDSVMDLFDLVSIAEGKVERVQIDIVDGKFANNRTIDPSSLNDYETNLKFDYHLMVVEPIKWVEKCVRAQGDRIIGHIEKMSNQADYVKKVQSTGAKVGVAVDLSTDVEMIDESVLEDLNVILVMSVEAGFGGQEFDKSALEKISELVRLREKGGFNYKICDDGGVTIEYIDEVEGVGADEVIIGINKLKKAL